MKKVLYVMVAENDVKTHGKQVILVKLKNKKPSSLSLGFSTIIRILR
jgi:hypothetical protein